MITYSSQAELHCLRVELDSSLLVSRLICIQGVTQQEAATLQLQLLTTHRLSFLLSALQTCADVQAHFM